MDFAEKAHVRCEDVAEKVFLCFMLYKGGVLFDMIVLHSD